MKRGILGLISVVLVMSSVSLATATVVFDDDFLGTSYDTAKWDWGAGGLPIVADSIITLSANRIKTCDAWNTINGIISVNVTAWEAVDKNGARIILQDNEACVNCVRVTTDAVNSRIEVEMRVTGELYQHVYISLDGTNFTGNWALTLSTTKATLSLDGMLLFDSNATSPDGGDSWNIPAVDMKFGLIGGYTAATSMTVDRVVITQVLDPLTVVFDDDFLGTSYDTAKWDWGAGGLPIVADSIISLSANRIKTCDAWNTINGIISVNVTAWEAVDKNGARIILQDDEACVNCVRVTTDAVNSKINIEMRVTGDLEYQSTSISLDGSNFTGNWALTLSTTHVTLSRGGTLLFDSNVTSPDSGVSWNLPAVDMKFGLIGGYTAATSMTVDRVVITQIPDPFTVVFDDDFPGTSYDNAKWQWSSGGLPIVADSIISLSANRIQTREAWNTTNGIIYVNLTAWESVDKNGARILLLDDDANVNCVRFTTDAANSQIDIQMRVTGESYQSASISLDGTNFTGNWALTLSETQATLSCGGTLLFDSNTTSPDGGDSWNIPAVDMKFGLNAGYTTATSMTVDRVVINQIPDPFPFVLKYIYTEIEEKKLCVGIFQNYSSDKGLHGKLSLLRPDGTVVVQSLFNLNEKEIELTLSLDSVEPGDYEIVAELLDYDSRALIVRKESFVIYSSPTPWDGNNIGESDTVPVPWTPIIVDDNNTVNIWGRQYVLGKTGLPEEITSQGRSITGGHVKFVVRDQSGEWTPIPMSGEEIKWLQKSATVVEYTSVFSDGDVQVELKGTIEYDGFYWFDIKCIPLNGSPFPKDIAFEIPINCEVVKLVNDGTAFLNTSGIIPESGWKKNLLGEWPVFWFGDESCGIQWFADDLRGWSLKDYSNSAEIIIEGTQPCVRIRLIDAASQETRERNIGFGIMATPVKELPSKWRTDLRSNGKKLKLWWQGDYITKLYGYPEMVQGFREKYAAKIKQGINWLPYLSFLTTNPYSPEYKYFGETWRMLPQERNKVNHEHSVAERWGSYIYICPNSESYRDFYMWKLKGFVEDADLHGLYFDFVQPQYRCSNTAHGCGWEDSNGDLRETFRIRGMRKLAKRIYTMLKEHDPNAPIVYHDSGFLVAPIHGFAEMTWDGEHHVYHVAQYSNYYDLISLEKYRVNFLPRPWGIITCIMPQFLRSVMLLKPDEFDEFRETHYTKNKKAIWHLAGLALLHDGAIDPGWDNDTGPAVYGIREIQDDFGWGDDLEFLPYWDSNTPCRIETPISKDIVISAYRNSEGVMLVPFNNTDNPITAVIIIEKSLEIPESAILTDAITGLSVPCENGLVTLNIESRSYAILIWKHPIEVKKSSCLFICNVE